LCFRKIDFLSRTKKRWGRGDVQGNPFGGHYESRLRVRHGGAACNHPTEEVEAGAPRIQGQDCGCSSVVEHWPSMCKALGSIPNTAREQSSRPAWIT
jgi:hypothetical protein